MITITTKRLRKCSDTSQKIRAINGKAKDIKSLGLNRRNSMFICKHIAKLLFFSYIELIMFCRGSTEVSIFYERHLVVNMFDSNGKGKEIVCTIKHSTEFQILMYSI